MLSIEGEYGYLNERASSIDPNQFPYANIAGNNVYGNSSLNSINIGTPYGYVLIGGRIGYIYNQTLFYVKSGAVFTKVTSQYNSQKTDSSFAPPVIAYLNFDQTNNITTYAVGAGIEYILPFKGFSNVSAKIEYLYIGLNKTLATYGHCSCDFLWQMNGHISGINTVKLGINYNWKKMN